MNSACSWIVLFVVRNHLTAIAVIDDVTADCFAALSSYRQD